MFWRKQYVFLLISDKFGKFEVLGVFTTFDLAKSFYNHYYYTDRELKIIKKVLNTHQRGK
jgi:hypothetical protein